MEDESSNIDEALDSELESFDRFMTGRSIEGERRETLTEKELDRIERVLEKPLPERFVQEKLLKIHSE